MRSSTGKVTVVITSMNETVPACRFIEARNFERRLDFVLEIYTQPLKLTEPAARMVSFAFLIPNLWEATHLLGGGMIQLHRQTESLFVGKFYIMSSSILLSGKLFKYTSVNFRVNTRHTVG
jgi:hypothetical protein